MSEENTNATWSSTDVKQDDKEQDGQEISKLVRAILLYFADRNKEMCKIVFLIQVTNLSLKKEGETPAENGSSENATEDDKKSDEYRYNFFLS